MRDSRFREDLYYRVNAFAIRLPSLRERQVDIPVLGQRFLARYCAAQGLPLDSKAFSREAIELLVAYPWPGNIRELESTVSRAALSAPGRTIRATDVEFLHATEPHARPARGAPAVAGRRRARARRAGPRGGQVEQEGGGARAGHQPRHVVPQDRRVRAGARRTRKAGKHGKEDDAERKLLIDPIRTDAGQARPEIAAPVAPSTRLNPSTHHAASWPYSSSHAAGATSSVPAAIANGRRRTNRKSAPRARRNAMIPSTER